MSKNKEYDVSSVLEQHDYNGSRSRSTDRSHSQKLKKKAPQKPPRKNKPNNSLSPRSVDSMDTTYESIDTSFTESEAHANPADLHGELDKLKPRTNSFIYACIESRSKSLAVSNEDNTDNVYHQDECSNRDTLQINKSSKMDRESRGSRSSRRKLSEKSGTLSSPIVRSFEEYKRGYFDEIFYEQRGDSKFSQNSERNIVNVSEIMKIRARRQRVTSNDKEVKTTANFKPEPAKRNVPTVKQFLLDLPSTKIEHVKQPNTNESSSRQGTNIQSNLCETRDNKCVEVKQSSGPHNSRERNCLNPKLNEKNCQHSLSHQTKGFKYGSTNDLRSQSENQNVRFRRRSNSHGSEYNKHKTGRTDNSDSECSITDWSFGYPRKSKQSQTNVSNGGNENNFMFEFLQHTDGRADERLDSDSGEYDSDVFESDDEKSILTERCGKDIDINNKCSTFVQSSTIGISGMGVKGNNVHCAAEVKLTNKQEYRNEQSANSEEITPKSVVSDKNRMEQKENNKDFGSNSNFSLFDVRGITEFVAQGNYEPEADNELPMKHGEIVHVGLDGQDSEHWYWAFSPRMKKYGFVPRHCVRIPLVTII